MSLILDALRKLERDKRVRDPGVVVVGQVPWGGRDTGRRTTLVVVGALAVLTVGAGAALMWLARKDAAPVAVVPASATNEPGAAEATPAVEVHAPTAVEAKAPVPTPSPRTVEVRPLEPPPARETALPPVATSTGDAALQPAASDTEEETPPGEAASTALPAPAPRPRLLLTAISERDGEPVAVLNDRLVREGDSVDGARVLRIGATEIEVEIDGKRQVIGF